MCLFINTRVPLGVHAAHSVPDWFLRAHDFLFFSGGGWAGEGGDEEGRETGGQARRQACTQVGRQVGNDRHTNGTNR